MNRMDEFRILSDELVELPPRLEGTLARAESRRRSARRHTCAAVSPLAAAVVFLAVFVTMVNVSLPFARACGGVPILGDLAAAVAFSPSLSAAVKNKAVQVVDQSQTQNGVTVRIRYLIADTKQLYVFYTAGDAQNRPLTIEPRIRDAKTRESLPVYISWDGAAGETGALRSFTIDFTESEMPSSLLLDCSAYWGHDNGESSGGSPDTETSAAQFSFSLRFDPKLTQQRQHLTPNIPIALGGQSFTLSSADIYPTFMRINLDGAAGNTAWLRGLQFYVTDEKGRRFEAVSNGITASGEAQSPAMNGFRCESPFFFDAKHLTAHITGAALLDASMRTVCVDLKNAKASALPEGVALSKVEKENGGWRLTFTAKRRQKNASYPLFQTTYIDPLGNEKQINAWETLSGMRTDPDTGVQTADPDTFTVSFSLPDYPYDTVNLSPEYSRFVVLQKPIEIRVR